MANKDSSELLGVLGILREALKRPYMNNKKLILFIALFTIIIYYFLPVANIKTLESIINGISMDMIQLLSSTDPTSSQYKELLFKLKEEALQLIVVIVISTLFMAAVSVLSTVATIYVSAISYLGKGLKLNDLCLRIKKIWTRPVITWFYVCLLMTGFFLMVLPIAFIPVLFVHDSILLTTFGVILLLLASVLNIYMTMVWMMSLVVSVLEGCYGIEALGVAEKLTKGRKRHGFVLTLIFSLLGCGIFLINMLSMNPVKAIRFNLILAAVQTALAGLLNILRMMVYTVFYFDCKKFHGEEVQVNEDFAYSKIATIHLVDTSFA